MQFNTEKMALLQYHKSYLGFYIVAIRKKKRIKPRYAKKKMISSSWEEKSKEEMFRQISSLGYFIHFFIHLRGIKKLH